MPTVTRDATDEKFHIRPLKSFILSPFGMEKFPCSFSTIKFMVFGKYFDCSVFSIWCASLCLCWDVIQRVGRYSIFELSDGSFSIDSSYSFSFLWLLISPSLSASVAASARCCCGSCGCVDVKNKSIFLMCL